MFVCYNFLETKSNNIFGKQLEQQFLKLLLGLLFLLKKARMRGKLSRSLGKGQYMFLFHLGERFSLPFFAVFVFTQLRDFNANGPNTDLRAASFKSCFQKARENRKVRFDYTSAHGLHVSPRPRRGAPKAGQNDSNKLITNGSHRVSSSKKIKQLTNSDPQRHPNG